MQRPEKRTEIDQYTANKSFLSAVKRYETVHTTYHTVYKFKKSVIRNWKPRTFYLITQGDQGKTGKVTKALLVKCAPATGRRKCNGSQQQMLFYYTSQTELVDQWFGNISNKIETREKKN